MHHDLSSQTVGKIQPSSSSSWLQGASLVIARIQGLLDWRTVIAFVLPLCLYFLTMAPTIYNLDSAELTTAAATGGIVRATGYPLYLTIGHLWSRLPVGDVGYRMNLFSAVMGALTIGLSERILRRLGAGFLATIGALGLLASATFFWGMSLVAEVYTLHTALMSGLILALLRWKEEPSARWMALIGMLAGLSLSHHAATVLLIPGSLWYVISAAPRRAFAPRVLAAALVGLLVGLSFYLYLPLRYAAQPAFNYAGYYDASLQFHPVNLQSLEGLWWLVSGKTFINQMLAYTPNELWRETLHFLTELSRAFFTIGVGPGLLGLVVYLKRDWRAAIMLILFFVFSSAFYINYRVLDKDTMFLPSYLVWALWVGIGYQWLLDWLRNAPTAGHSRSSQALGTVMLGAVLAAIIWNWPLVDLSRDWSARELGETILSRAEPEALILGWWDTVPVIQYLQLVEGRRPDVQAVSRFLIAPQDLEQAMAKEVIQRPVYMDDPSGELFSSYRLRSIGPIYRLFTRR